jgi:hypothetical protein
MLQNIPLLEKQGCLPIERLPTRNVSPGTDPTEIVFTQTQMVFQGVNLTIHLYLMPSSKMVELYLHSPYVFKAWSLNN